MTVYLHINKKILKDKKESVLHLMPCKIHGDEPANVSSHFNPYIRTTDDKYFNASFRGYPLQGKKITVPTGYSGFTFYEYKKPDTEKAERNLYTTGSFSQFTYWNYDKVPSRDDAFMAALDWIDIAEALHSPMNDSSD